MLAALSKILSMGGDPFSARLSLQEYFGKVTNRETWGKPLTALLGAFDAILDFGTPLSEARTVCPALMRIYMYRPH